MERIRRIVADIAQGKYSSREVIMVGVLVFFCGIITGICCAPRKQNMFGCFNSNKVEIKKRAEQYFSTNFPLNRNPENATMGP